MSAGAGLRILFATAERAPWLLRALRPALIALAPMVLGKGTAANAQRIFGRQLTARELRAFARGVARSFYDFVLDIAELRAAPLERIKDRIAGVEGEAAFMQSRQSRRGAILVTAHMGSFEVGLAALRGVEPRINVVFKRDAFPAFERMRSDCRRQLGVTEAPVDDGWTNLLRLREALERNEVIVMQGDRALPGQRAQECAVLGGHLRLPVGPVTLARLLGSPVIPVFVVREAGSGGGGRGRFRVHMLPPIEVTDPDDAIRRIAAAISEFVRRYPTQWLVLTPAFVEDQRRVG